MRLIVSPATLCAFFAALIALLATSQMMPLTWDEGESIDRAEKLAAWCHSPNPLSQESIHKHWIFTTQIEGHPAGYGIVIAAGYAATKHILPPKTAYRFGPIFLFALAVGAVFSRLEKTLGVRAAIFAAAAILLTPRLFAHAHIAACDSTLTACWLLAWAFFDLKTLGRAAIWGFFLGLTFAAKFTGWIAVIPFFLTVFLLNEKTLRKRFLLFGSGLGIALLTFYVLNPPLWFEPIHGFAQFFTSNTTRKNFNISILFLGRMYNLDHPLPWYNTLVWTAITVPVGFLLLGIYGLGTTLQKSRRRLIVLTALFHALSLLIVRAVPGTPPHDGVRLFVTAYAFLAIITGIGADAFFSFRLRQWRIGIYGVILIYGIGAFNLCWYAPQWLSYYNAAIGGLAGAAQAGMEPTYYWDSLDRDITDWLEKNTAPNELIAFSASSVKTLSLQKEWGELRTDFYRKNAKEQRGKKVRYYVLQRRPSGEYAADKRLMKRAKPVYTKLVRRGGVGLWKVDDVPLLEIYEIK